MLIPILPWSQIETRKLPALFRSQLEALRLKTAACSPAKLGLLKTTRSGDTPVSSLPRLVLSLHEALLFFPIHAATTAAPETLSALRPLSLTGCDPSVPRFWVFCSLGQLSPRTPAAPPVWLLIFPPATPPNSRRETGVPSNQCCGKGL